MHLYWIWLALARELSLRKKLELLQHFSSPEAIYEQEYLPNGIVLSKNLTPAETVLKKCRRRGIQILCMGESQYPVALKNISDPPLVLYCLGQLPDMQAQPVIGVVGTRKASSYGLRMAQTISAQLAQGGALLVSGGAAGVDAEALKGALTQDKPCVAVLGTGVDVVYPTSNRKLFMDLEEKGCLLSEYPPGTGARPWQFPARNRIISGLSAGVLVVEAPEKSGALITARDAMEQGRDVFVIPGNIDSLTCIGSNQLLQEGALAAMSAEDILRQYTARYPRLEMQPKAKRKKQKEKIAAEEDKINIDNTVAKPYSDGVAPSQTLTQEEAQVLACVERKAVPMDSVLSRLDIPAPTALRLLTKLSLMGMVTIHPGKLVSRN